MKRILIFFITAVIIIASFAAPCSADDGEKSKPTVAMTRYAYVYNLDDDFVLYEENADKVIYPASTAKIMTAIIAIEYYRDAFDTKITISEDVINASRGGTVLSYKLGEILTVEQLLYGLIVANGNDAAYALALSISETEEDFVKLMNEKAEALGAKNTHFANPTGVDDNLGYTTVRDLAAIACYAARMKGYTDFSSVDKYDMPATNMVSGRTMANKNYLVSRSYTSTYYLSYCVGLNAGATVRGGDCCVAVASKNGVNMLAIAMNVGSGSGATNYAFADTKSMLEWAYDSFGYVKVLASSEIVYEVPVRYCSSVDYVSLLPKDDVYAFLPFSTDVNNAVKREYSLYSEVLDAPIEEGQEVGEMLLFLDGQQIGSAPLVTKNALHRSNILFIGEKLRDIFAGIWGIVCVCVILLVIILGVLLNAYTRARRRGMRRR